MFIGLFEKLIEIGLQIGRLPIHGSLLVAVEGSEVMVEIRMITYDDQGITTDFKLCKCNLWMGDSPICRPI